MSQGDMPKTPEEFEKMSLSGIIDGFSKQSVVMPTIAMRYLELEGGFSEEQAHEAVETYKHVMKEVMDGKNLTICHLAAMLILAELNVQANIANTRLQEKREDNLRYKQEDNLGYG
jgi:hypothetical protein